MANKNLPKYENPPPPPPKTDEGKEWAKYFWEHLEREAQKSQEANGYYYAAFGFVFLVLLSLLVFLYFCR